MNSKIFKGSSGKVSGCILAVSFLLWFVKMKLFQLRLIGTNQVYTPSIRTATA
jgi:hypothetical protein